MTNFIFKSVRDGLVKNFDNKLTMILSELRHQRSDNVKILSLLNKLLIDKVLQKQATEYYDNDAEILGLRDKLPDINDLD